jgi:hypothetical protein
MLQAKPSRRILHIDAILVISITRGTCDLLQRIQLPADVSRIDFVVVWFLW